MGTKRRARAAATPPVTPDGRYFAVRGRLWRCSDPALPSDERERLVLALMDARRAVGVALRAADPAAEAEARAAVDAAKRSLGERGPVWWRDGAPDLNRRMASATPYAAWFAALASEPRGGAADPNDSGGAAVGCGGPGAGPDE